VQVPFKIEGLKVLARRRGEEGIASIASRCTEGIRALWGTERLFAGSR